MLKLCVAVALLLGVSTAEAQSLKGSRSSMRKQFNKAKELDLTRLKNRQQVERFKKFGLLVELRSNKNYRLDGPSYPYVRPAVKKFVERWSAQSRPSCSDGLVVTSLTRPLNRQPRNASKLSVHPAGLSVDFRIPSNRKCRAWMERTLLSLEEAGVLDATRERNPPHYHVAIFPDEYNEYLSKKLRPKKPVRKAPAKRPIRKRSR